MRITLISDLHLESQPISGFDGGDVLLLAGDTCETRNLHRFESFREEISEKFRDVYVIAGNHEHYGTFFDKTIDEMKNFYAPCKNIHVMDNQFMVLFNDVVLFGGTLWTDFNGENYGSMQECKHQMNDYYLIRKNNSEFINPEDTLNEHYKSFHQLKFTVEAYPTKKFIVMTHHAPSNKSIHAIFKQYTALNGGFVNDLDQFILDHPQIKFWGHGHVHNSFDYKIGECRIMSNPRGYGKENKFFFDKNFSFEV